MKNILHVLILFIGFSSYAQVTIVVEDYPKESSKKSPIFISGDFEGWSGGKKEYQLQKTGNTYSITLPKTSENINFKFTQGSWASVESDEKGLSLGNRMYTFKKEKDTLKVAIANWSHLFKKVKNASTASKNVSVLKSDFVIPQLNTKRRVWLYLPTDYAVSKEKYAVVYMHDGQNLFDKSASGYGEWKVDETLDKLYREKGLKLIVVGVDHGGSERLNEYSPYKNEKYGGGKGDAYLDFVVNTLKPYIDSNYRTLSDKKNTAIMGSSMGGLISHYAALKYPKVFGKVGVYSPAFWFSPEINKYSIENGYLKDTRMYFLAGGKEGTNVAYNEISKTVTDMNSVIAILKKNGFTKENIKSKVVAEGKHNEKLWSTNFEETILWLFKDIIKERSFVDAKFAENQLEINVSDGAYKMHFYQPEIIETSFAPKGEAFKKDSHAVVLNTVFNEVKFKENSNNLVFSSAGITVKINKQPFKISYFYKDKEITSEKRGYYKSMHEPLDLVKNNIIADKTEKIQFNLSKEEVLFGAGSRALGMNRRGYRLPLYNRAHYGYEAHSELMNFTLPIVISSKKYMLHFDNAPIGYLDLDSNKENSLTYETISGRKTYQVIAGNSWQNLIENYTNLTGKQPLPARWTFGNFSSRFGYHSQQETEVTIDKFKEEEIPVDAVILDLYWFGKTLKGTMGNLEVYKDSFPDMKGMISRLKNKGVKTVLITEPFILSNSKKWNEAVEKDVLAKDSIGNPAKYDFYFGNTGIVDIYKKEGKKWFWNIYKDILNLGAKGLWGDLGEPEVHPNWVQHATGSADEIHNIYGHDWARLIFESYKEEYPNERPFILMRAGAAGSQRFGMIPWSGDVNRTWGGLQSQPEIALQMGVQGLGYMHSDLGGFAGNNLDDNLYNRWLQYGVFQPIFRPHAQEEVPSEPVFRSKKAKQLAKESIVLRYKMLPYNYNLAFENNQKGTPLMRPIFYEEDDVKLMTNSTTYLWGKDFLITPILKDSVKTKEIYFPKTANWVNFYTDEKIKGGTTKNVSVKENSIPTYVRNGTFILMTNVEQTTDNYKADKLELHYYFDTSKKVTKRTFYNDDGLTAHAFEKGKYEVLEFEAEITKKYLEIDFEAKFGSDWKSSEKEISLIIHNLNVIPKKIKIDGKRKSVSSKNNSIEIPLKWNPKKELNVKITLN